MIYWDNAATTWPKPSTVRAESCKAQMLYGANPGRSGHKMSLRTAEQIYLCREEIARYFGLSDPGGVIFTANCTMSLNMVIRGLLDQEGRALTSDLEHNAVMRPLTALSVRYPRFDAIPWCEDEDELVERFRKGIQPSTRLLICTHASNVFGVTLPIRKLGRLAREKGLLFCVDAAQTAGVLPIDMEKDGIDYLCVAPHKGLYAPMGTGLLLCRETKLLRPLISGGTGSHSISVTQPPELPDRLESGTPNTSGICGIRAGVQFLQNKKPYEHEMRLLQQLYDGLQECSGVHFYAPRPEVGKSAAVLSLNVNGFHSEETARMLDEYDIAVRAGLHCAPAAHRHFGTLESGTVRFSPSAFSTANEVAYICKVFSKITEKTLH